MTRARQVVLALVVAGMAYYAVEGGEYGTMDLLALRKQVRGEREAISRLRMDVDSLAREQHALANDPVVQEAYLGTKKKAPEPSPIHAEENV